MNLKYSELSNENSQVIRGPVLLKPKYLEMIEDSFMKVGIKKIGTKY